jgi:lactobin A/cerein 7B family class IIb bacteriocin
MNTYNFEVIELTNEELVTVDGGMLDPVTATILAVGAGLYAVGTALGHALWYATHP